MELSPAQFRLFLYTKKSNKRLRGIPELVIALRIHRSPGIRRLAELPSVELVDCAWDTWQHGTSYIRNEIWGP